MSREIELLTEIRDLLEVIAEPALAQRDAKRRSDLRTTVGSSKKRGAAVLLMDGIRNQKAIKDETGIDQGDLSRLVKALGEAKLIGPDPKQPKLLFKIPPNFFDVGAGS